MNTITAATKNRLTHMPCSPVCIFSQERTYALALIGPPRQLIAADGSIQEALGQFRGGMRAKGLSDDRTDGVRMAIRRAPKYPPEAAAASVWRSRAAAVCQ